MASAFEEVNLPFPTYEPETSGEAAPLRTPISDYLSAEFESGWDASALNGLMRMGEYHAAEAGESRMLQPDEAQKSWGVGDLKFDRPIKEDTARILNRRKREEMDRQYFLSHGSSVLRFLPGMAASTIGGMLNPVDLGLAFVPFVGEEALALKIAKAGGSRLRQFLARGLIAGDEVGLPSVVGHIVNAAGFIAVDQVPNLIASAQDHADFATRDYFMGIGMNAALVGVLHPMGRLLRKLGPETKEAIVREQVNAFLKDEAPENTAQYVKLDENALWEQAKFDEKLVNERAASGVSRDELERRVLEKYDERIQSVAFINPEGEMHVGKPDENHFMALERLFQEDPAKYERLTRDSEELMHGFMTDKGRFVHDRTEAGRLEGMDYLTAESLDQTHGRTSDPFFLTEEEKAFYEKALEDRVDRASAWNATMAFRAENRKRLFFQRPEIQELVQRELDNHVKNTVEELRQKHDRFGEFGELRRREIERQIAQGRVLPEDVVQKRQNPPVFDGSNDAEIEKHVKELKEELRPAEPEKPGMIDAAISKIDEWVKSLEHDPTKMSLPLADLATLGLGRPVIKGLLLAVREGLVLFKDLTKAIDHAMEWFRKQDASYHGTKAQFEKFDFEKLNEVGAHFGTLEQAQKRGGEGSRIIKAQLDIKKPFVLNKDVFEKDPRWFVREVFPTLPLGELRSKFEEMWHRFEVATTDEVNRSRWVEIRKALREAGYDAVKYKNEFEGAGESIAILSSEQIHVVDEQKVRSTLESAIRFEVKFPDFTYEIQVQLAKDKPFGQSPERFTRQVIESKIKQLPVPEQAMLRLAGLDEFMAAYKPNEMVDRVKFQEFVDRAMIEPEIRPMLNVAEERPLGRSMLQSQHQLETDGYQFDESGNITQRSSVAQKWLDKHGMSDPTNEQIHDLLTRTPGTRREAAQLLREVTYRESKAKEPKENITGDVLRGNFVSHNVSVPIAFEKMEKPRTIFLAADQKILVLSSHYGDVMFGETVKSDAEAKKLVKREQVLRDKWESTGKEEDRLALNEVSDQLSAKGFVSDPDDGLWINPGQTRSMLAWMETHVVTMPDGRRVLHVFEVQSDVRQSFSVKQMITDDPAKPWVSEYLNHKGEAYSKEFATKSEADKHNEKMLSEYQEKVQPLIDHTDEILMKAAVKLVKREGLDGVVVSDPRTAMLTQGHIGEIERSNVETGGYVGSIGNLQYVPYTRVQSSWSPPSQAAGMQQAYGKTLPGILRKATGHSGEEVVMGPEKHYQHKNIQEGGIDVQGNTDYSNQEDLSAFNEAFPGSDSPSGTFFPVEKVSVEKPYQMFKPEQVEAPKPQLEAIDAAVECLLRRIL